MKIIFKVMFHACAVITILLLSGCLYIFNPTERRLLCSSDDYPFVELRSKSVVLKSSMNVVGEFPCSDDNINQFGVSRGLNSPLCIPPVLPKGTKIKFVEFWRTTDYRFFIPCKIRYEALFVADDYPLPEYVYFQYVWGKGRYLHRAPWEDETIPESRYIGFDGKGYRDEKSK